MDDDPEPVVHYNLKSPSKTNTYEIEQFLDKIGLVFLKQYFTEKPTLTLSDLHKMDDTSLETVLGGRMYVKRLKDELNKL